MLNNLLQKFEALSQREKWMMILALLAVLWGSWDALFYTPLQKQQKALQQQLAEFGTGLATQHQLAIQLQASSDENPNLLQQQQLAALKIRYQHLQEQIAQLGKKFVPPSLMANLLSDLLRKNSQLKLIELKTLPVTLLLESAKSSKYPIYKHGLLLRFSGTYLATLNYLKSLESMPWNFIWASIDYKVETYPLAKITLKVYTLSFEKDWLDV